MTGVRRGDDALDTRGGSLEDGRGTTSTATGGDRRGMNKLHSSILAGGLLVCPVVLTVHEVARLRVDDLYVEHENDALADAYSHLDAVSDHLGLWHAVSVLEMVYAASWALAMLAIVLVVARSRPVLAVVVGALGLVSTLGAPMHTTFYFGTLDALAQVPDRDLAAHAAAAMEEQLVVVVGLIMFLIGTVLAILAAGFALWRARALPWWGAVGLLGWAAYVFVGSERASGRLRQPAPAAPVRGGGSGAAPRRQRVRAARGRSSGSLRRSAAPHGAVQPQ